MRLVAIGIFMAALSGASAANASLFTPGGVCAASGFGNGQDFHADCVDRVKSERKSFFWREEGPYMMAGAVAGVAANGGTAFAVMNRRPENGVRRVDLDGESFLVRITGGQATVRSAQKYKHLTEVAVNLWRRAAEVGTGCRLQRQVRDMDALYLWLNCSVDAGQPEAVLPGGTIFNPQGAPQKPAASVSLPDELEKLASLRQRGLLSEAEFEAAKAKLLGR